MLTEYLVYLKIEVNFWKTVLIKDDETRNLKQFHFTAWPDHGVPNRASPIIAFRRKVRSLDDTHGGPMITHCRCVRHSNTKPGIPEPISNNEKSVKAFEGGLSPILKYIQESGIITWREMQLSIEVFVELCLFPLTFGIFYISCINYYFVKLKLKLLFCTSLNFVSSTPTRGEAEGFFQYDLAVEQDVQN